MVKDLFNEPVPGVRRLGCVPLLFGLNAVVALVIGFVFGWAVRPAVPAPSRSDFPRLLARPLPKPPGVGAADPAPFGPQPAPGQPVWNPAPGPQAPLPVAE